MLDTIHKTGLRLILGAFRTSPVASLYVEADAPSLYARREKLFLQYNTKLSANPSNPAHCIHTKICKSILKINLHLFKLHSL